MRKSALWRNKCHGFDGAAKRTRAGAGIVLVTPDGAALPYSFSLTKACTNNMAEYEALIIGLELALDMGADDIEVFGDSKPSTKLET